MQTNFNCAYVHMYINISASAYLLLWKLFFKMKKVKEVKHKIIWEFSTDITAIMCCAFVKFPLVVGDIF